MAEELIFGPDNITTGASSDFEQATRIAHLMVTKFGMSEKVRDAGVRRMEKSKEREPGERERQMGKESYINRDIPTTCF